MVSKCYKIITSNDWTFQVGELWWKLNYSIKMFGSSPVFPECGRPYASLELVIPADADLVLDQPPGWEFIEILFQVLKAFGFPAQGNMMCCKPATFIISFHSIKYLQTTLRFALSSECLGDLGDSTKSWALERQRNIGAIEFTAGVWVCKQICLFH